MDNEIMEKIKTEYRNGDLGYEEQKEPMWKSAGFSKTALLSIDEKLKKLDKIIKKLKKYGK